MNEHEFLMNLATRNHFLLECSTAAMALCFAVVGAVAWVMVQQHRDMQKQLDSLFLLSQEMHDTISLTKNYASSALHVSQDTDQKLDAAKTKLEAAPSVMVIEADEIKLSIEEVSHKVDEIPGRVADEVRKSPSPRQHNERGSDKTPPMGIPQREEGKS